MQKLLLFFTFFVFLVNFSFAKKRFTYNQGGTEQKEYFVKIPYKSKKGLQIIKVKINDEFYNFLFDTGSFTIVSESLATKLNLKLVDNCSFVDSGNNENKRPLHLLKEIELNSVTFKNIPTVTLPDTIFTLECFEIDGIIGSNLLRNSVVQISQKDKMITLTNSAKKLHLEKKNAIKLVSRILKWQSNPYFTAKIRGKDKARIQLLFDSGMTEMFDLSLRNMQDLENLKILTKIDSTFGSTSIGVGGSAKDSILYELNLPKLKLNELEINNVKIQTTVTTNSRVGAKLLKYATVTIDYPKKRIYFTPIDNQKVIHLNTETKRRFPITPNLINDTLRVGAIWNAVKVPNIKKGDKIIAVDSIKCQELNRCEQFFFLSDYTYERDSVKIVTEDKTGTQHSTWIKQE